MGVEIPAEVVVPAGEFPAELREAVLKELAARQLDDAGTLAERMQILPIAAEGLLRRHKWTVETAIWVITTLGLPIELSVNRVRTGVGL